MSSPHLLESLLPCNTKLVTLWRTNPSHPVLRAQVRKELDLERQKIRVVLQFLLIKDLLSKNHVKAYRKRLKELERVLEKDFGGLVTASCCEHGTVVKESVKTCDLTAEAAERFVKGGPEALKEWVSASLKKVKTHQRRWRSHCKSHPMTEVNWTSKKEAYKRLGEWAVAECLALQKKDLKTIKV